MTPQKEDLEATVIQHATAILGEGALWHPTEQVLYWVDIEGKALHIFDPETKANTCISVGERVGTVVPVAEGGALVALQNGIHYIDTKTGTLHFLTNPIEATDIRFNDGKCDPAGRFWVGTMALDARNGVAKLYRMDKEGNIQQILDNLTISNGIAWSGDKETMYLIDTPTQQVKAFDYNDATGDIRKERTVVEIPKSKGSPDGMTIDADGNLWIALHRGGAVVCYNPNTGKALQQVNVPCPQATSCVFGGKELTSFTLRPAGKA